MPTYSPDYRSVLDLSRYPGAYYSAGDPGGGSEGAAPSPAGYYLPGSYYSGSEGGGFSAPQYLPDAFRPATYQDFDFSQINDPNSAIRKALTVDPSMVGKNVTLWGGTPYTIKDQNDPVSMALSLFNMGAPQDQLASLLGPNFASQIPQLQSVYNNTNAFNDATRNDESTIMGIPTPVVLAALGMGVGGLLGGAAAGIDTAGGATGALGTAEASGLGLGGLSSAGDLASLLGPATGTVESAPVIGASGVPQVSGIAQGAGAFVPTAAAGSSLADLASFTGPQTGTVESAPVIGASGVPQVSGIAQGAGAFIPPVAAATGGTLADLAAGLSSGASQTPGTLADLAASGGATTPAALQQPATLADMTAGQGAAGLTPAAFQQPAALADLAAPGAAIPDATAAATPAGSIPGVTPPAPAGIPAAAAGTTIPTAAAAPVAAAAAGSALPGVGDAGAFDQGGSAAFPTGANANGMGEGSIFAPAAAGGGTALSRLLDGTATTADMLALGGTGLATGLGIYGANQQTQAYKDLANQYMAMGAPYRQKLSDLYANPSSYLQSSEVQVPVQQGTDALARSLSIHGNPAGSGAALQELQNYSANQLYGRLGQEKDRLAGYGGLTQYNAAAPGAASAGIGAQAGTYNALGYGLGQLTNPPSTLEQSLRAFRGGLGSLT